MEHFWNHEYRHYKEGSIKRGATVFFFPKIVKKNAIANQVVEKRGIPAAPAVLRSVQNTMFLFSTFPSVKAQLRTLLDKKDRKNQGSTQLH